MKEFQEVQLRRVFRVINGGTPTSDPSNWDGHIPWATPVDLGLVNGNILASAARSLTDVGLASGSGVIPAGSLLISTRAPIGYVAEVVEQTAFNQGCRGLVPVFPVDIRYFRYQLSSSAEGLRNRGQGSTFLELSSESLAATPIRVPGLPLQRAIADYLDAETTRIDALIEKKRRMTSALEQRWRAFARVELERLENIFGTTPLKRIVRCLDGRRIPLSSEERSTRHGPYPVSIQVPTAA